jgi:chemotaxis protein CheZ
MSGDSPDLEALFDSVASTVQPRPAPSVAKESSGDTPDLEALFDSIASTQADFAATEEKQSQEGDTPELESLFDSIAQAVSHEEGGPGEGASGDERVFAQVGHMTRSLHNLLRELGFEKALADATQDLPDTRDRLNYIAVMTAQAAERTLNAAEAAQPIQASLGNTASDLAGKWDRLFNKQLGVEEFKALVHDTRDYLKKVPEQAESTNDHLMQIIMAQDFQDLTGQVIKKVLAAAQNLEQQLITLLLETTPEEKRQIVRPGLLEGPVVNASNRSDVVTSQEQVDELLESLGF